MSEKKNTKEFLIGNSNIFDNSHLDERQKADAYRITFKLFISMIYTIIFMSMFAYAYAAYTENMILLIAGAVAMIVTELFIVLYAAMTSSKGAMNLEFAQKTSKPSYAVIIIASAVVLLFIVVTKIGQRVNIIFILLYFIVYFIANLLMFYYSRRNMKVLEKQLKDDDENDE